MSLFLSQIEETFAGQTKEKDFEKIDNHYRDKTFRFKVNENEPQYNCFIS